MGKHSWSRSPDFSVMWFVPSGSHVLRFLTLGCSFEHSCAAVGHDVLLGVDCYLCGMRWTMRKTVLFQSEKRPFYGEVSHDMV